MTNIDEPCRDCKKRGASCGKTLPAHPNQTASEYSSSPSPSSDESSPFVPTRSNSNSVDVELRSETVHPSASLWFQRTSDYARHLERTYPYWAPRRIITTVGESIERGSFGELSFLLRPLTPTPPSPQHPSGPFVSHQSATPPIYATYPMPTYPHHASATRSYVNPATLTMPFNYTEALNREESPHSGGGSDTTAAPDFETPVHFNYDPHGFMPHPALRYNNDHYSGFPSQH